MENLDPAQLTEDKLVSASVREEVSERGVGEEYVPEAVGENLPENLTKGIASAMISAIFDQQPATDPQKNYLRF